MKKSQLTLTDMNKKLIDQHNVEVDDLNRQLKETREELISKRRKLDKYVDIVSSFSKQMEEFERFQETSNREVQRLKDQVAAQNEEKESLLKQI